MKNVLSVRNLKKIYDAAKPVLAVDGISFSLKEGEILGFLGPNGSGKTTTIQMLLGILSATSGEIVYFDREFPRYRSEVLHHVSFASTYTSLPFLLTIEENLRCFGGYYGLSKKEIKERGLLLLERFGIANKINSSVGALSAGQITRLMLVKAFLTKPKIALLDEPTASLDPDVAKEVCDFLLEQRRENGLSILFTSHKMAEVAKLCDRVVFLRKGKVIADDLPQNLAKSISSHRLILFITEGLEKAMAFANEQRISYQLDQDQLKISLEERQIPPVLNRLMQLGVVYERIQIEEPSLEDYFLKIAEQ